MRDWDVVARLGGDEFAVVLADAEALPAASVAARLVERSARPTSWQGHTIVIGTSIGIALSEPGVLRRRAC